MQEQDWYAGPTWTENCGPNERARSASPSAVGGPVGASKENATPSHWSIQEEENHGTHWMIAVDIYQIKINGQNACES